MGACYITAAEYEVDIGSHVFPTAKYRLVVERLVAEDAVPAEALVRPPAATDEDVLRVHTESYFGKCRDGTLDIGEQMQLELPWSSQLFAAAQLCVGGSILAARHALRYGVGLHIGGGFHHAFPDHGEGFCVFNDPACAIRAVQNDRAIERAVVVDCDLHHGNGTAAIFAEDPAVATFSMHQQNIYPAVKPPSDVDVGLDAGTGDDEYLNLLETSLLPLLHRHRPELVVYVAGADPYRHDQLGNLELSLDGLARRDAFVVDACRTLGVPVMVVLAGGYARAVADTVSIHLQTLRCARTLWR